MLLRIQEALFNILFSNIDPFRYHLPVLLRIHLILILVSLVCSYTIVLMLLSCSLRKLATDMVGRNGLGKWFWGH